jgi:uncharacterized membrane protein
MGIKRHLSVTVVAIAASSSVLAGPASAAVTRHQPVLSCTDPRYLPDLGFGAGANALNDRGTVVGLVVREDGTFHAAVWRHGHLVTGFDPGYLRSTGADVNDRGTFLWQGILDGVRHGWVWTRQRHVELTLPAGTTLAQVRDLNERDGVVGTVETPDGEPLAVRWDAPMYRPRILPLLPGDPGTEGRALNDHDVAVGASAFVDPETGETNEHHAVFWGPKGDIHVLSSAGAAQANGVDAAGEIAGAGLASPDPDSDLHALFWDRHHRLHDLGNLPGAHDLQTFAMSRRGWVAGRADTVGWVWPHRGALVPLPTPAGLTSLAHGVNDRGQISGQVGPDVLNSDEGNHAAIWSCRR